MCSTLCKDQVYTQHCDDVLLKWYSKVRIKQKVYYFFRFVCFIEEESIHKSVLCFGVSFHFTSKITHNSLCGILH